MSKSHRVYFDGYCKLCQFWVQRLYNWDKNKKIVFVSLQSSYAKEHLPEEYLDVKTIVYQKDKRIMTKSTAVLSALKDCHLIFHLLRPLFLIPKSVRDFFYDWIAKNRYKWFGRSEKMKLDYKAEPNRFILK